MYFLSDDQREKSPNFLVPIAIDGLPTIENLPNLEEGEIIVCELDGGEAGKAMLVCQSLGEMQHIYLLREGHHLPPLQWFIAFFREDVCVVAA